VAIKQVSKRGYEIIEHTFITHSEVFPGSVICQTSSLVMFNVVLLICGCYGKQPAELVEGSLHNISFFSVEILKG